MTILSLDALDVIVRHSKAMNLSGRSPAWTPAEDQFIRQNLGRMTDEEMGLALGRTAIAVHLRWHRDLQLPGPSKATNILTANTAARLLGIDSHKTAAWVDLGLIPGRIMAGGRNIRLIDRQALRRWVLNPMNWVYFDPKKVRDPELKRMLALRAARWGDEWWSTPKVAKYHGVATGDVKRYITKGWLKSFRLPVSLGGRNLDRKWSNHFVLKSDAIQVRFATYPGIRRDSLWTAAADAWILKARDELGMTFVAIGRTMKIGKYNYTKRSNNTIMYRYHQLKALQKKNTRRRAK
ncbi:MAG TPA: hypothetical protein VJ785_01085 [Anaerolineales bacterium]|nr:hypothetical protein [Anaerolineales bacterium]